MFFKILDSTEFEKMKFEHRLIEVFNEVIRDFVFRDYIVFKIIIPYPKKMPLCALFSKLIKSAFKTEQEEDPISWARKNIPIIDTFILDIIDQGFKIDLKFIKETSEMKIRIYRKEYMLDNKSKECFID